MKKDLVYFENLKEFYQITNFPTNQSFEAVKIKHTDNIEAEYIMFKLGERKCRHFIVLTSQPDPMIIDSATGKTARVQSFYTRTKRGKAMLNGVMDIKFKVNKVKIEYFLIDQNPDISSMNPGCNTHQLKV